MKLFLNEKENLYNLRDISNNRNYFCGGLRTKGKFKRNKKNSSLISIITVVKDDEKNISKTIKSVLDQNFKNFEYIIVDGNSSDETLKKIKKFQNKIDLWISHKDKNLWQALNMGIKYARGDIIGILNSKDFFYANGLKIVNNYFQKFKIDFLFGAVKKKKIWYKFEPDKIKYRFNIYPSHSCGFFIKKKSQKKLGLYNTHYDFCSDYDLFYRMIVKKKMIGMPTKSYEVLGKFDPNGISSKLSFLKVYYYEIKIRYNNGQNIFFLFFLLIIKLLNKIRNVFIDFLNLK